MFPPSTRLDFDQRDAFTYTARRSEVGLLERLPTFTHQPRPLNALYIQSKQSWALTMPLLLATLGWSVLDRAVGHLGVSNWASRATLLSCYHVYQAAVGWALHSVSILDIYQGHHGQCRALWRPSSAGRPTLETSLSQVLPACICSLCHPGVSPSPSQREGASAALHPERPCAHVAADAHVHCLHMCTARTCALPAHVHFAEALVEARSNGARHEMRTLTLPDTFSSSDRIPSASRTGDAASRTGEDADANADLAAARACFTCR